MRTERFLVLGSNSFSGAWFISYLIGCGHEVLGISRSEEPERGFLPYKWKESHKELFTFKRLDVNRNSAEIVECIRRFKPSHIVNFAAQGMVSQSWNAPVDWYRTNVLAQVELHEQIRNLEFIEKYVHVTTPEVYGSTEGEWVTEKRSFDPSTPYAVSRAACDMHLMSFYKAYDFPVVFTRAANVYGEGQSLYRIVPRAILSARTGQELILDGGGESVRSFIHIEDVSEATYKLALDAKPGSTWHISTNEIVSIRELVERIFNMCQRDMSGIVKRGVERLAKDQTYLLNSDSLRKTHDWQDEVSLEDGLRRTIEWVDANLSRFKECSWCYEHKV